MFALQTFLAPSGAQGILMSARSFVSPLVMFYLSRFFDFDLSLLMIQKTFSFFFSSFTTMKFVVLFLV